MVFNEVQHLQQTGTKSQFRKRNALGYPWEYGRSLITINIIEFNQLFL